VTSDQDVGEATCGQGQRHRKTNVEEMGEGHTASHVERQPKAKKTGTPAPPTP
jgi:hypothetical protein